MQRGRQSDPLITGKVAQATTPTRDIVPANDFAKLSQTGAANVMPQPRATRAPLPRKMPTAPIDAPRMAELLVFQPISNGRSSFGHVAIDIDGTIYSWTPGGLFVTTKDDYLKKNAFRDGTGYPLRLTDQEAKKLKQHILNFGQKEHYNFVTANCTDPIEEGLEALGYQVGLTILPAQLKAAIMQSHLASIDRSNDYPADPAQKSSAATMPWSLLSMP